MRMPAGGMTAALLLSIALLCVSVACGGEPPGTLSTIAAAPDDAPPIPSIEATVAAAKTANAVSFTAQTAAARAATAAVGPLRALPTPLPTRVSLVPSLPASPVRAPTVVVPVTGYTAAFPVVSASDLAANPDHYNGMRISLVGRAYHVHTAKGTTTFYVADDDAHTHSAFVSYEGVDASVQENAPIQVYGIGANTIHVVSGPDEDGELPFVTAVLIRVAQ